MRADATAVSCVSKGERKCIIKNPTKIEKIKEPSHVDWSGDGWSCGWPVSVDSKQNKNGKNQL